MSETKSKTRKLIYFILGAGLPVAAYFLWGKTCFCTSRKAQVDKAHDATVEDSFPASDPPSAW
jgi:hypothetical protein